MLSPGCPLIKELRLLRKEGLNCTCTGNTCWLTGCSFILSWNLVRIVLLHDNVKAEFFGPNWFCFGCLGGFQFPEKKLTELVSQYARTNTGMRLAFLYTGDTFASSPINSWTCLEIIQELLDVMFLHESPPYHGGGIWCQMIPGALFSMVICPWQGPYMHTGPERGVRLRMNQKTSMLHWPVDHVWVRGMGFLRL